jgi:hypothetical protein
MKKLVILIAVALTAAPSPPRPSRRAGRPSAFPRPGTTWFSWGPPPAPTATPGRSDSSSWPPGSRRRRRWRTTGTEHPGPDADAEPRRVRRPELGQREQRHRRLGRRIHGRRTSRTRDADRALEWLGLVGQLARRDHRLRGRPDRRRRPESDERLGCRPRRQRRTRRALERNGVEHRDAARSGVHSLLRQCHLG